MLQKFTKFFFILATFSHASSSYSLETDDFYVPTAPLKDVGPVISNLIFENLENARNTINQELQKSQSHYEAWTQKTKMDRQLEFIRKGMDPLKGGMLDTGIEMWLYEAAKKYPNIVFKPKLEDTIMSGVVSPFLGGFLPYSGTINLYGLHAGMDKIGHFLALGFDYFEMIDRWVRQEKVTYPIALQSAVQWGSQTENGGFGKDVSGIYSNADLAANYAGLHFYASLFYRVKMGNEAVEPLYLLTDAGIELNPHSQRKQSELVKPFVTPHWNESLNPSLFFNQPETIRKRILAHCNVWMPFHGFFSSKEIQTTHLDLELWYGHDYGHRRILPGATYLSTGDICKQ